jgi:2-iminobutanoate/2-iminopropanoate deaminase
MTSPIRVVTAPHRPEPRGHYSRAIVHGDSVYVSGILPVERDGRSAVSGSLEEQTLRVLTDLGEILGAAGSEMSRVVKLTVYVKDIGQWEAVNRICARVFGNHRPARTIVPVSSLHYGCLIEIDAIAAL